MKKRILNAIAVIILPALTVSLVPSCAYNPSQPGGPVLTVGATNQLILRAEQTAEAALTTFTLLVHLERDNEALLREVSPSIHSYANQLRDNGPGWIKNLRDATKTFKANRNANNEATLLTALAVVNDAMRTANQYIAQSRKAIGQ